MSEDVSMFRELVEEFYPGVAITDEEVVRIGLTYVRGYRDGCTSVEPPPKEPASRHRVLKTGKGA